MKKTTLVNVIIVVVCLALGVAAVLITEKYSPGQVKILLDGVKLLAWLGMGLLAPVITIAVMIFQNSDVADTINIGKLSKIFMMVVIFVLMVSIYPVMGSSLDKFLTGNSDINTTAYWTIWGAAQYLVLVFIALAYRFV